MSLHKPTRSIETRRWVHVISQGYVYTPGPIGAKFLNGLREGRILGGRCSVCGNVYLPPKAFCQFDFGEIRELVEVGPVGNLATYTVIYRDGAGNPLPSPQVVGLVVFNGALGGLIHYVKVDPRELRIGMRVRPVFKQPSERRGSIRDIEYFEKAE